MRKILILVLAVILFVPFAQAQKFSTGKVVKSLPPFEIGDTIPVYGMKVTNSNKFNISSTEPKVPALLLKIG